MFHGRYALHGLTHAVRTRLGSGLSGTRLRRATPPRLSCRGGQHSFACACARLACHWPHWRQCAPLLVAVFAPFADLRGPFLLGMYSITGADASLCGLPGPLSGSAPMCAPFAYAFCPRPSLYLTRFGRRVLAASASTPSWPLRFALASVACFPVSHPRFAPTHSAVLASI